MSTSFDHMLIAAFQGLPVAEILDAPPDALRGVSADDAAALDQAFGITSIRELAENRFFERAQSMLAFNNEPRHDTQPAREWDAFFATAPLQHYAQHPTARFRHEFGPVYYRGRLDGSARVLILGQDPAANEIIAHRVFVGNSGQRIQGLLGKMGITRSYIFLNTFLYSVYGQFDAELRNISLEDTVMSYRHAFLDRLIDENQIEAIWSMGNGAHHAIANWPGIGNIPLYEFTHPAAQNHAALFANWNAGMNNMRNLIAPDEDGNATYLPYGATWQAHDLLSIPRFDLPFGIPGWHGVGSRARRGPADRVREITWTAP